MTKYAKTKDNKIVKVDVEDGIFTSKYELVGEPKNTIEELCDEFVAIANYGIGYGANPGIIDKENIRRFFNSLGEWTVYGAIWIKGENEEPILKSVAKMNEKGELELI